METEYSEQVKSWNWMEGLCWENVTTDELHKKFKRLSGGSYTSNSPSETPQAGSLKGPVTEATTVPEECDDRLVAHDFQASSPQSGLPIFNNWSDFVSFA